MKDKRRGFTLVELMVVLSILLLASVLISGILIQGYKVYNRTENYSVGEDQFRKAVMSIENVVEDYNSKDVFIYTNKNKILLINDNYEIDNQESLMVVVPKGYAKKNIVYIKATNKNGDINLLQVSFSIDDKTRLLNDDKSDNISISVSNDDIVILINNLDISNNIEFSKNENLINMNIIGIKGNVDREYSSSFSTDINEKMDIELGINGEGSNNGNGNIGSVTTDKVNCNIFNHFISAKNIDINVKEFISQKLDVIRCEGIKFNKINGNEVEVEYGDVYPPSFTFLKKNSISINNIDSIDKTYITDEINEEDILNGVGYIEIDGYKVYLVNYYQVNINQSSNLENTIFICNGDININLINDIRMNNSIIVGKNVTINNNNRGLEVLNDYNELSLNIQQQINNIIARFAPKNTINYVACENEYNKVKIYSGEDIKDWQSGAEWSIFIENNTDKQINSMKILFEFIPNKNITAIYNVNSWRKIDENNYEINWKSNNSEIQPGNKKNILIQSQGNIGTELIRNVKVYYE